MDRLEIKSRLEFIQTQLEAINSVTSQLARIVNGMNQEIDLNANSSIHTRSAWDGKFNIISADPRPDETKLP